MLLCDLNSNCREFSDPGHVLNIKNLAGMNLLAISCIYGYEKLVKTLLNLGCCTNIRCYNDFPIELAFKNNHMKIVDYFLRSRVYDHKTIKEILKKSSFQKLNDIVAKYYY